MKPESIQNRIRINTNHDFNLRNGDTVKINVIKRLIGNKWAIGLKGRVHSALSDVELIPGQELHVKILKEGKKLVLQLNNKRTNYIIDQIIKQIGSSDKITIQIINCLIKSRMTINPEIIKQLRKSILKYRKVNKNIIRCLAIMLEKGIDTDSNISSILDILNYEDLDQRQNKKQNKKAFDSKLIKKLEEKIKDELKRNIRGISGFKDNPLQIFNHLKENTDFWVVIPFKMNINDYSLSGTIKILFNVYTKRIVKFVFGINNNNKIYFFLRPKNSIMEMEIYTSSKMIKRNELNLLISELKKLNVKCNENVFNTDVFDGFSSEEDIKSINTIG